MAGVVISGFFENRLSEGCFLVTHRLMKTNLFPSEASDSGSRRQGQPAMFFCEDEVGEPRSGLTWIQSGSMMGGGVMHNTPGNKRVHLGESKPWLTEVSDLSWCQSNCSYRPLCWPELKGTESLTERGRAPRVMTYSVRKSNPGAVN